MKKVSKIFVCAILLLAVLSTFSLVKAVIKADEVTILDENGKVVKETEGTLSVREDVINTTEKLESMVYGEDIQNPYNEPDVPANENGITFYKDDLYDIQEIVDYEKLELDGNAYIIAKNSYIKDAVIKGNLFIISEEVVLDNVEVTGSLYLACESADIDGKFADTYIAGNNINLKENNIIERGLRIVGEEVSVSGNVLKNCYVAGKDIIFEKCNIAGDLSYTSENEAEMRDTATIVGETKFSKREKVDAKSEIDEIKEAFASTFLSIRIIGIIFSTAVITSLILVSSRKFVKANRENVPLNFLASFGIGLLTIVFIPIISLILIFTMAGAGIGVILLVLYFLILYCSTAVVSLAIAVAIFAKKLEVKKVALVGTSIAVSVGITLLKLIPEVTGILGGIVVITGLGIVVRTLFYRNDEVTSNNI